MRKIKTIKKYKKLFNSDDVKAMPLDDETKEKKKLALSYALEIRKFEIDLYWKRTAYFWTLITVAFAGYFTVNNGDDSGLNAFIIACLGLILSVAWYLVNRGSKFWQKNWEMHVDALENDCIGPLYKTTRSRQELSFWDLHKGYPFSVSKVNQLVSLYAVVVWCLLIIKVVPSDSISCFSIFYEHPRLIFAVVTLVGIVSLLWLSNGKNSNWERRVDFEHSKLKDAEK